MSGYENIGNFFALSGTVERILFSRNSLINIETLFLRRKSTAISRELSADLNFLELSLILQYFSEINICGVIVAVSSYGSRSVRRSLRYIEVSRNSNNAASPFRDKFISIDLRLLKKQRGMIIGVFFFPRAGRGLSPGTLLLQILM